MLAAAAALAVVCATETVDGIDVSKWQGTIDWPAVAADGIRFAIIRTNHGLADIDEQFDRNWAEARANGIIRGAYQYYLPTEDPIAQADLLLERMGALEQDDLPPTIDVEEAASVSPEDYAAGVQAWSDRVESVIGRKPMIYTGKYFWNGNLDSADFIDNPLWVAQWGVDCPDLPDPWTAWTFHQTSSSGTLAGNGARVDTDLFNGTYEDLLAFAAGSPVPPTGYPLDPSDPDPDADPDAPSVTGCSASGRGSAPGGIALLLLAALTGAALTAGSTIEQKDGGGRDGREERRLTRRRR
jgi:lysozyme